jgi:hypothetical protein
MSCGTLILKNLFGSIHSDGVVGGSLADETDLTADGVGTPLNSDDHAG